MRQVLSLSLPDTQVERIKRLSAKRGYRSVSAYAKHLFLADQDLMSEAELLKAARAARKEYRAGHSVKAKSLADLL